VLDFRAGDRVEELAVVPTDRRVALRLLWLLDDPRAPLDEIGRVITADPALSARVLAVANADYYGAPGKVTTISRAVTMLGMTTVRTLATTSALELFIASDDPAPEGFWLHSVTAAVSAASIATQVGVIPAEAMAAGLLHDLGKVLLRARDTAAFDEIGAAPDTGEARRLTLERETFESDHAERAAQTLGALGMPSGLVEAVALHHAVTASSPLLARVVHAADRVAHGVVDGPNAEHPIGPALELLGISDELESMLVMRATEDQRAVLRFLSNFLDPAPDPRGR